ncbi:hypothetical protein L917_02709 [Phytophthora nicotianae]|uniref:REJ domain-containing protein n=1 Tax=Phytophthora nicotianae TaxID=4792 RepID=W2LSW6_PHYNI|nr:hypothetical protein L917_02709 [Phytophthora nicotianae]
METISRLREVFKADDSDDDASLLNDSGFGGNDDSDQSSLSSTSSESSSSSTSDRSVGSDHDDSDSDPGDSSSSHLKRECSKKRKSPNRYLSKKKKSSKKYKRTRAEVRDSPSLKIPKLTRPDNYELCRTMVELKLKVLKLWSLVAEKTVLDDSWTSTMKRGWNEHWLRAQAVIAGD